MHMALTILIEEPTYYPSDDKILKNVQIMTHAYIINYYKFIARHGTIFIFENIVLLT
jgi:hypothetical protein